MGTQFDELAQAYERSATEMPFREHIEAYSLLKVIGPLHGLAVLDMGCGSGLYTRRLRDLGASRMVGVDASQEMIDFARRHENSTRPAVEYLRRDATRPTPSADPGLDGSFDLVTAVYVLPYATTEDELTGFCRTARRALRPEGGRFVAATLNPDFATEPGWYQHYGMALTAKQGRSDGAPVALDAWIPGHEFHLTAHFWSHDTHQRALRAAGFTTITWLHPEVSEQGRLHHGDAHWRNYLEHPHALILDCHTGPAQTAHRKAP